MDKTARDVLATVITRLKQIEEDRIKDTASIHGFLKAAMEHYPVLKEKYILFQTQHADKLAKDPAHDLVYVYDGMLELLQRPDDDDIPMPPPTSRLQ